MAGVGDHTGSMDRKIIQMSGVGRRIIRSMDGKIIPMSGLGIIKSMVRKIIQMSGVGRRIIQRVWIER
jgi:hypothetical protein